MSYHPRPTLNHVPQTCPRRDCDTVQTGHCDCTSEPPLRCDASKLPRTHLTYHGLSGLHARRNRPPVKADPNAAGGLFAITRPVGAQVFLDNKLIGTTPLFMSQLSSGSHEVRLELPGFKTYSSSIQVEPNTRFRLAVQLEETR